MIRRLLHDLGYVIAPVLFVGVNMPESVVKRLRVTYRLVGVRIVETPQVDPIEGYPFDVTTLSECWSLLRTDATPIRTNT